MYKKITLSILTGLFDDEISKNFYLKLTCSASLFKAAC